MQLAPPVTICQSKTQVSNRLCRILPRKIPPLTTIKQTSVNFLKIPPLTQALSVIKPPQNENVNKSGIGEVVHLGVPLAPINRNGSNLCIPNALWLVDASVKQRSSNPDSNVVKRLNRPHSLLKKSNEDNEVLEVFCSKRNKPSPQQSLLKQSNTYDKEVKVCHSEEKRPSQCRSLLKQSNEDYKDDNPSHSQKKRQSHRHSLLKQINQDDQDVEVCHLQEERPSQSHSLLKQSNKDDKDAKASHSQEKRPGQSYSLLKQSNKDDKDAKASHSQEKRPGQSCSLLKQSNKDDKDAKASHSQEKRPGQSCSLLKQSNKDDKDAKASHSQEKRPGQSHSLLKQSKNGPGNVKSCPPEDRCSQCRLCGQIFSNPKLLINIFGSQGRSMKLLEKAKRCLPVSISHLDGLPSTICRVCVKTLLMSFKLVVTAIKTNDQLSARLHFRRSAEEKISLIQNTNRSVENAAVRFDDTPCEFNRQDLCSSKKSPEDVIKPNERDDPVAEPSQPLHHLIFDHTYTLREDRGGDTVKKDEGDQTGRSNSVHEETLHNVEATGEVRKIKPNNEVSGNIGNIDLADEEDIWSDGWLAKCSTCEKVCPDEIDLQFHIKYECVVCGICGIKCRSRRSYEIHIKKHKEGNSKGDLEGADIEKDHESNTSKEQSTPENVLSGKDSRKEKKPRKRNRRLKQKATKEGDSTEHSSENEKDSTTTKEHKCPICGKHYTYLRSFKEHQKLHDPTHREGLRCDVCSRMFSSAKSLANHKSLHAGQKQFCCDVCPRLYYRRDSLIKHLKTHKPPEHWELKCSWCEEKFEFMTDKHKHEREKHASERHRALKALWSKPKRNFSFTCNTCGKTVRSKMCLIEHERIHTGVKPCVCEHCGRCFRTKKALRQHVIVHTQRQSELCHICGKKFARKSCVRQHMRVHTADKPFSCDFCGKQFNYNGALTRHKRRHEATIAASDSTVKSATNDVTSNGAIDALLNSEEKDPTDVLLEGQDETEEACATAITQKLFPCGLCVRSYKNRGELRKHKLADHGHEKWRFGVKRYILVAPKK